MDMEGIVLRIYYYAMFFVIFQTILSENRNYSIYMFDIYIICYDLNRSNLLISIKIARFNSHSYDNSKYTICNSISINTLYDSLTFEY